MGSPRSRRGESGTRECRVSQRERKPRIRSFVDDAVAGAVVSLPCARCTDLPSPEPHCSLCGGEGIEVWRVPAEQAAWDTDELRARYDR